MAQAIKWSSHGRLVVTMGVQSDLCPFQCRQQMAFTVVPIAWSLATRSSIALGGTASTCSFTCPHRKSPLQLDPATEEAMQLTLDVPSSFLDLSCSTTARHLPNNAVELCRTETTTSASQLEARLRAVLVKQFPEDDNIIEPSACQVADRGPWQCPRQFQPKHWRWSRLNTHVLGLHEDYVISCKNVAFVDVEQTLTHKTCFVCHRMLCKKSFSAVYWCRSHSQKCIHRGQSSGKRCDLHE
jgi:hypothetical protein